MEELIIHPCNGHWEYEDTMGGSQWYGFIYMVINTTTDRKYIGRKIFRSGGKAFLKSKSGKRIPNTKKGSQTNWKEYTGSSSELNEDIKKEGLDSFRFICLGQYTTKGGLTWSENWAQTIREVLTAVLPNGDRAYYNKSIAATRFIPPESVSDETKVKMSISMKKAWLTREPINEEWRSKLTDSQRISGFNKRSKWRMKETKRNIYVVNGIEYTRFKDASEDTGLAMAVIHWRMNVSTSEQFKNYYVKTIPIFNLYNNLTKEETNVKETGSEEAQVD